MELPVNSGKMIRLSRAMNEEGKTVIVAMDHSIEGVIPGLADMKKVLISVMRGEPEGIILTPGSAKYFGYLFKGKNSPALIIALDNFISSTIPKSTSSQEEYKVICNVEEALKMGADLVKVLLVFGQEETKTYADNIEAVSKIIYKCENWGVPIIVEPTLWGKKIPSSSKNDPQLVRDICRIAAELGADIVKVPFTGSSETFKKVTASCPVPVVVMGGPKMKNLQEVLQVARDAIKSGAIGIVFGRNVWEHRRPDQMVRMLKEAVYKEEINIEELVNQNKTT